METGARYGLRFYLGSEVERLRRPDRPPRPHSQAFAEKMREYDGCRVLLADPWDVASLESNLRTEGITWRRLADARGYAVLAQLSPDCPAYARLSE